MATKAKTKSAQGEKKGGFIKKFLLFMTGLLVAGGSAAGVVFFFYQDGMPFQEEGTPPLVKADANPFKIRPENPEGMEFAHRESTAYDAIENPEGGGDDGMISLQDPPDLPTSPAFDEGLGASSDNPYQEDGDLPTEALALLGGAEAPVNAPAIAEVEPVIAAPDTAPDANAPDENAPESENADPIMKQAAPPLAAVDAKPVNLSSTAQVTAAGTEVAVETPVTTRSPTPSVALDKTVRIQLGSLRSKALAEREWKRLVSRHGALLQALTLHVKQADLGARGIFYRVQAGPLESVQAANGLCRQLESRKVGCLVVRP